MPRKEDLKTVEKVWGEEIWLVNRPEYCGKLLLLDRGAQSSYHYHKAKTETFYCLEGYATLTIEDKDYVLTPFARPKTIFSGEKHMFLGITQAVILEISTYHDDEDVIRLSESKPAVKNEYIASTA